MVTSFRHHLSNLLIISIVYNSINGVFAQPPSNVCPPFDCGNGVVIRYPLWHQSEEVQERYCGYQGLNVSCHDQNPVLNLSNNLYDIRSINYSENSLIISYAHRIKEPNNCPKVPINITFALTLATSSVFNSSYGNKMLSFFYNCTLYPPSQRDITCLQSGTKRSFAFAAGAIPEFDWHTHCESTVTVPVLDEKGSGATDDKELLVSSFARALTDGFKLTWRSPAGACRVCEASNSDGFCGYSNGTSQSFFCICPDGRHSFSCYGGSAVTILPNYLTVGALTFGALIIVVAIVSYSIYKNRLLVSYKPVSHK